MPAGLLMECTVFFSEFISVAICIKITFFLTFSLHALNSHKQFTYIAYCLSFLSSLGCPQVSPLNTYFPESFVLFAHPCPASLLLHPYVQQRKQKYDFVLLVFFPIIRSLYYFQAVQLDWTILQVSLNFQKTYEI